MWEQYLKMWKVTQAVILAATVLLKCFTPVTWLGAVFFFIGMQAFSILGARWGIRLRGKVVTGRRRKDGLLM